MLSRLKRISSILWHLSKPNPNLTFKNVSIKFTEDGLTVDVIGDLSVTSSGLTFINCTEEEKAKIRDFHKSSLDDLDKEIQEKIENERLKNKGV